MASIEFKCSKCKSKNIKIESIKTLGLKEVDVLIIFIIRCTDCGESSELKMFNE